jgi:hypothetical protein
MLFRSLGDLVRVVLEGGCCAPAMTTVLPDSTALVADFTWRDSR